MAKKQYTPEFKQQIVDLYQTGNYSYSQLQSEYDVPQSTIAKWFKDTTPIAISETETISYKDYKSLQKENQRLRMENEILHQGWTAPKKLRPYSRKLHRGYGVLYPEASEGVSHFPIM